MIMSKSSLKDQRDIEIDHEKYGHSYYGQEQDPIPYELITIGQIVHHKNGNETHDNSSYRKHIREKTEGACHSRGHRQEQKYRNLSLVCLGRQFAECKQVKENGAYGNSNHHVVGISDASGKDTYHQKQW
jgi:hypothetical protein